MKAYIQGTGDSSVGIGAGSAELDFGDGYEPDAQERQFIREQLNEMFQVLWDEAGRCIRVQFEDECWECGHRMDTTAAGSRNRYVCRNKMCLDYNEREEG